MKTKRFLALIIAVVMCLCSTAAFATVEESDKILVGSKKEIFILTDDTAGGSEEEIAVDSEEIVEDSADKIEAIPDEENEVIDYSDMSNWAYWNEGENKTADLFFICPTVDMGEAGNYIADINGGKYRKYFIGALCQELGIYNEDASVYAPFYRQATFPVYSFTREEQDTYISQAYEDVKKAFIYYAENTDPSRPLILAGFSQGADHVIRLMKDLFDQPEYQRRLVAAYSIGWRLTEDEVREYPHLKPAEGETDTGVIIAFNSEAEDVTSSIIVSENEKTYAINPINWRTDSEKADKELNKGACFTDYSGNIKQEIPAFTGAYIDEARGTLKVTDVEREAYSSSMFDEGVYHLYDYQFFYRNLQENVKARLDAYNEKYADRIDIYYNDDIMGFDVEPEIENGRTLVPFRAIFEVMGCAVYYTEQNGSKIVSARRGNDALTLTIGENKMYFNGEEIALDVPAKIKNGRTLVPLRAISEAFECEVLWNGDTRTVFIYSPSAYYTAKAEKLAQTITDDNGNTLIEAVAYYPVFENTDKTPYLAQINDDYKWDAEKFMKEAMAKKEDAMLLRDQMGEDAFTPFVFEMTFEQTYNLTGEISVNLHKYINVGGIHPTKMMESRVYCVGLEEERSFSTVIDENSLGEISLSEYVTELFVNKLNEIDPEGADIYTYDYVREYIGYIQFYITRSSVVLYANQGEIAPYALGEIMVEIPYDPELFLMDMGFNCLDEYVYELEYDMGYEWQVTAYADEKLTVTKEATEYDTETISSERSSVGMYRFVIKGIKKGNANIVLAHTKKGEGIESATRILLIGLYVDENNKVTFVNEQDGMFLLD